MGADFVEHYGDLFRPSSPPLFVQRLIIGPLARLARRRGLDGYRNA